MKHRTLIRAAGAALMMTALFAAPSRAQDTEASIYEAARKEGKVVHWGSPDDKTGRLMAAKFTQKYPGVVAEILKIQSAAAIERVLGASNAGRSDVDSLDTPLGYMQLLMSRGLIDNFNWNAAFGTERDRVVFNGGAVVGWHLETPIIINTSMVKQDEIKSWDDLLNPKWRGKLLIEARGFAFSILALKWGEEKTFNYLRALMATKPVITKGGTATIEALAGGQGAIGVGGYGGILEQYKAQGAPVDWAKVGPVPTSLAVVVPLKNSKRPNATRLWTNFVASQDGQDLLYTGLGLGMLTGQVMSPLGKLYQKAGVTDFVMEVEDADRMQKLFAETSKIIGALQ